MLIAETRMKKQTKAKAVRAASTWTCVYDDTVDPANLSCTLCDGVVKSWDALRKHLTTVHGVEYSQIRGTFLDKKTTRT